MSDEMRGMILGYMNAYTQGDSETADKYLETIKKLNSLCPSDESNN